MKTLLSKLMQVLAAAVFAITLFAFMPLAANADSAADLASQINSFNHMGAGSLTASATGNTVIVGGNVSGVKQYLKLNIDSNVTVEWKAGYTANSLNDDSYGMINLSGGGAFVNTKGVIINEGSAQAIRAADAAVYVKGGIVSAQGKDATAIQSVGAKSIVSVSDGSVTANDGRAIRTDGENAAVSVSGGSVYCTNAGGSAIWIMGNFSTVNISGGAVKTIRNKALYIEGKGVKVWISGGDVSSIDGTVYGYTVYALGSDCEVSVTGGRVNAFNGYAIYMKGAGASVNVEKYGMVTAGLSGSSSGYGVYCAGGNSRVTVRDYGYIYAIGSPLSNIAIANGGAGSRVSVYGGKVVSGGIGSMAIACSCDVDISGGLVSATGESAFAILINGQGSQLNISGGEVTATGEEGTAIYAGSCYETGVGVSVSGGSVNASGNNGTGILAVGSYTAINVSGGEVRTTGGFGTAIKTDNMCADSITVNVSGGTVSVKNGCVISSTCNKDAVNVVEKGKVIAAKGFAIRSTGDSSKITVSGDGLVIVETSQPPMTASALMGDTAIWTSGKDALVAISGGKVSSEGGAAVRASGDNNKVKIVGGTVCSWQQAAVCVGGANSAANVEGGFVFAPGRKLIGQISLVSISDCVMFTQNGGTAAYGGDGIVCAWDRAAGNTVYIRKSSDDLIYNQLQSGGYVIWDILNGQAGISYLNGSNGGFFPIPGVTVKEKIFANPKQPLFPF